MSESYLKWAGLYWRASEDNASQLAIWFIIPTRPKKIKKYYSGTKMHMNNDYSDSWWIEALLMFFVICVADLLEHFGIYSGHWQVVKFHYLYGPQQTRIPGYDVR